MRLPWGVRQFEYDDVGNLTRVIDERGNPITYAYDDLNRRTSATNAIGGVTAWSYDAVGDAGGKAVK